MLSQQEISDRLEITQLLYRYARAIDTRDLDALATVFTPDAVIDYAVPGGTRLPFPEMVAWLGRALRVFRTTQHALANPLIELDGDAARATTYLQAAHVQVRHDGEETCAVQYGAYADRLVRTPGGWRIAERRFDGTHVQGRFLAAGEARAFAAPAPPARR
jgi:3-phenylpropionate/cinnamic acid dioxygenase small subunit